MDYDFEAYERLLIEQEKPKNDSRKDTSKEIRDRDKDKERERSRDSRDKKKKRKDDKKRKYFFNSNNLFFYKKTIKNAIHKEEEAR